MLTSVDESKNFSLISEKEKHGHMVPLFNCCNYTILGHVSIQISSFEVLFMTAGSHNVLIPHINKTNLLTVSLNVRELELN